MTSTLPHTEEQMIEEAKRRKHEIEASLGEVCRLMDIAKAQGLNVGFSIAPDHTGRHAPTVTITKPLA